MSTLSGRFVQLTTDGLVELLSSFPGLPVLVEDQERGLVAHQDVRVTVVEHETLGRRVALAVLVREREKNIKYLFKKVVSQNRVSFVFRKNGGEYEKYTVSNVGMIGDGSPLYLSLSVPMASYAIYNHTDGSWRKLAIEESVVPESFTQIGTMEELLRHIVSDNQFEVHLRQGCRRWLDLNNTEKAQHE